MAFISVRNLIVDFMHIDEEGKETLGTRALDGISLDIEKGEFVAVVGMNGSGKSTLAKCLNGLILPTQGEVLVDGLSTSDEKSLWEIRKRVGMVFQNPDNQIVSSIVEDDVAFGPENLGINPEEIRARVKMALERVDMYDCKDKGAHMLSGGQKQRIAIAGAIAMKPSCIVFDEPTAMLDPRGRKQVLEIIHELNAEGITVILITHFMKEAEQADRIIALENGKIVPVPDWGRGSNPVFRTKGDRSSSSQAQRILTTKDLRYVYNPGMPGETVALDGIDLTIRKGEICGIIGHTGSGKSTLLQHFNGLIKPTEGDIYVDGQWITDGSVKLTDIRRKVGLVFQYPEYQLFEETVWKDVAFGPKNLGITGDELEKAVRESIEIVGLDYAKIKDKSPFELSGGMKRRVAIAGVIAMKPSILILDEPTAGLDPIAHVEILNMINRIHENMGITIIFVSHNMTDIANMSDRVIVINKGKIMLEGTPDEVFSKKAELTAVGLSTPEDE